MSIQLILIAMHGAGGGGSTKGPGKRFSPPYPWKPEDDSLKEFIRKQCVIDKKVNREEHRIYGGLFWKSVIDAGYKALNKKAFDEVKVICSKGFPVIKSRLKFVVDSVRKAISKSSCEEHIIIPVGKSMGVFDSLKALRHLKRDSKKNCCISFSTPLAIMIDGDNSFLNGNGNPAKVVPAFVDTCFVIRQENVKRDTPTFMPHTLIGRKLERTKSCCSSCATKGIKDYAFPIDTIFPDSESVYEKFRGVEVNHWTIDEYMAKIGYNGWTIGKLLDAYISGTLPEDLD